MTLCANVVPLQFFDVSRHGQIIFQSFQA